MSDNSHAIIAANTAQTPEQKIVQLVMQRAVLKQLTEITKALAEEIGANLANGQTVSAVDSAGVKLGTVGRSMPTPKARCIAYEEMYGDTPGAFIPQLPEDPEIIMDVMLTYAPEKLVRVPNPDFMQEKANEALDAWEATGEAPEGWRIVTGEGIVTVRPGKTAKLRAENMLQNSMAAIESGAKK